MLERPIDRFILPDDDGEAEYEARRKKWKRVKEVRSSMTWRTKWGEYQPLLEDKNIESILGPDYSPPASLSDALRSLGVPSPEALMDECRRRGVELAEQVLQWGLTIDEIAIVLSYTYVDPVRPDLSPSHIVNRILARGTRDRSQLMRARGFLFLLLSTLRKLPRFYPEQKRPFLYRAVPPRGDPEVPAATLYPRGTSVTWNPFISTSLDKTSAKNILFESLAQSSSFQDSADSCGNSSSSSDSESDEDEDNALGKTSVLFGSNDNASINSDPLSPYDNPAVAINSNNRGGSGSSGSGSGSGGGRNRMVTSTSGSENENNGSDPEEDMRIKRSVSKRLLIRISLGKVFSIGGASWGYDISTFTSFPTEQEVLLEPHRTISVKRVSTRSVSKGRFKYDIIEATMAKTPLLFEQAIPVDVPSVHGKHLRGTYVLIWSSASTSSSSSAAAAAAAASSSSSSSSSVEAPLLGARNYNASGYDADDDGCGCCGCFGWGKTPRPRVPDNLCVERVLWNGASLSWNPVRAVKGGRRVVYQVAKQKNARFKVRARIVYEGTDIKYDATPLNPGREYNFRVRAYDGAWSGWSAAVIVRTPSIPAPSDIAAVEVKWNQIRVRWTPIASYPGRTPKYIIDLWDPTAKILQSRSCYDAHCTFSDLTADTEYELCGSAGHNNLFENKSAPVRVRTSGWPLGHWRSPPYGIDQNFEYELDSPFIATFRGGSLGGACTVVGDTPLLPADTNRWSIRVVNSRHNNGLCFFVGVAPDGILKRRRNDGYDTLFECGWYMCLSNFELFSGPPHNYRWKAYGTSGPPSSDDRDIEYVKRRKLKSWSSGFLRNGKTVGVSMNTVSGSLSFVHDRYLGVAYSRIPLDRPLFPVVILGLCNDSVEFVTK